MSEVKSEEPTYATKSDYDYLSRRLETAYEERQKIKKMIRVVLAILIDKKLVGEATAKAFMESKEVQELMNAKTSEIPKISEKLVRWAEAKFWIKGAIKHKGALRSQLGIKEGEIIPRSLLQRIVKAEIGTKISHGGKSITVTTQLKRRALLALKLGKMKK